MTEPDKPWGIAPILLVKDVQASLDYFEQKLGFTVCGTWGEPVTFAIVGRQKAFLMLGAATDPDQIIPNWRNREKCSDVYVWVDDAKAVYEEFQKSGATIDYELYEAPHGCLEFGVQDLDDHDISFGQVLECSQEDSEDAKSS